MDTGGQLSLGMLSDDDAVQEEFILDDSASENLDGSTNDGSSEEEEDLKDKKDFSDGNKSQESVAEEDKSKAPEKAKPSPGSDNKMSQIYSSLAAHFHETGVLPSLNLEEKEIKTAEDLQEAIKNEITSALDEKQQSYEKAMQSGEPKDDYVAYVKYKEQLDNITDEVLEKEDSAKLRFNIIAQNFINKDINQEQALKLAKRSQDLGEDIEDAKSAKKEIEKFAETSYQQKVATKKQKEQEAVDKIKSYVNNSSEFIKGMPLSKAAKDNLIKQMTTAVSRDERGEPLTEYGKALMEDPVKVKAMTEYMFMVTKGFSDFSKISTAFTTKATKDIDDVLKNAGQILEGGKVNFNNFDDDSTFSIGDDFQLDI